MVSAIKKLLVINPFGIGDCLFTAVVCRQIKRRYPHVQITFLCNERTADILSLSRDIDGVIVFNRDLLNKTPVSWLSLCRQIRKVGFDASLDFSLVRQFSLLCFALGIPRRMGIDYKKRGLFLTHKYKIRSYSDEPVTITQCKAARSFGFDIATPEISTLDFSVAESLSVMENYKNYCVLAPGGGHSWGANAIYKQWDPDYFLLLARRLKEECGLDCIFVGDLSERDLLENIQKKAPKNFIFLVNQDLKDIILLLKKAKCLIANDSGLVHLANALMVKSIAFYGPVDENVYSGLTKDPIVRVVSHVSCRPCYQGFYFPKCEYDRQCLSRIDVDSVYHMIKKII